jgi:hypothetical protein
VGSATHRVAILVYDGVKLLDVVGPAEVCGEANRLGADYTIVLVSPTGADVTSSIGIRIAVAAATEPAPDTFLVAGADLYPRTPVPRDLIEATRTLAGRAGPGRPGRVHLHRSIHPRRRRPPGRVCVALAVQRDEARAAGDYTKVSDCNVEIREHKDAHPRRRR